jgi:hypothetical protein
MTVPEFQSIIKKFLHSPILRCADVQLVSTYCPYNKLVARQWYERRWSTTWDLAAALADVKTHMYAPDAAFSHLNHDIKWYIQGFSRYSSTSLLVRRIVEICPRVRFNRPPLSSPFDTIPVDAFEFISERPHATHIHGATLSDEDPIYVGDDATYAEKYAMATYAVDEKPTCAFHVQCTLFPQDPP